MVWMEASSVCRLEASTNEELHQRIPHFKFGICRFKLRLFMLTVVMIDKLQATFHQWEHIPVASWEQSRVTKELLSGYESIEWLEHFLLSLSLKNQLSINMIGLLPLQLISYGLIGEFILNIKCNHATLAGHSCLHEPETARINELLGNSDANTGDPQIGWDTDLFLMDVNEATMLSEM
ncbi:hypothetical protein L1987_08005 [Smallanthus sonchifolius]|uniref:Uncharacterized protein n=1 Tax=Smallanthus sonchifolius TaxID=185202 RepID=A0ACB9JLB0_9ASTR|nr:hypothetical protein L1987_08005 [Smallanthus sonchifolius]